MANLPKYVFQIDKAFFVKAFDNAGLSQNEVATRLKIDKGAMSLLLSGRRKMKIEEAMALAQMLDMTIDKIIAKSGATRPTVRARKA